MKNNHYHICDRCRHHDECWKRKIRRDLRWLIRKILRKYDITWKKRDIKWCTRFESR